MDLRYALISDPKDRGGPGARPGRLFGLRMVTDGASGRSEHQGHFADHRGRYARPARKSYKSTADAKDGVIKQQTEGLDAILKSRWQDRQAYTANLSAADGRAKSLTAQADKLIALKEIGRAHV